MVLNKQNDSARISLRIMSYVLAVIVGAGFAMLIRDNQTPGYSKLNELEKVINQRFISDYELDAIEDAAAEAMVYALGDRWSYYVPASEMQQYNDNTSNSYVGIGVTIQGESSEDGILIQQVEPEGPAQMAGILPGDRIVAVNGQSVIGMNTTEVRSLVMGEAGTDVDLTVIRGEEQLNVTVTRQKILSKIAIYEMLPDNVGYIKIKNFNEHCAEQTIAAIDDLVAQGATSLLFDVRFNPGGYVSELTEVLDYLLPEGTLFRSVDYRGLEDVRTSDKSCLEMPMAVLMNEDSYSAAEFFAAALSEYDWAITVGQHTYGKGYFQTMNRLQDGSGVNLSIGKYFTPKGVSLAEVGGLEPDVPVDVDDETYMAIYRESLKAEEDPQLQAALNALKNP